MSCYFVANITISNEEQYEKYLAGTDSIFMNYSGKYLAVDTCPVTLEGSAFPGRIIIIEFPDEYELKCWYESPEYQSILKHRLNAADCNAYIVNGIKK